MRRILLTGAQGQIGWELQRTLAPLGEVTACSRAELDLGKPQALRERVGRLRPEVIVNAAAYTAVDRAESEVALASTINAEAPGILAEEALRIGAWLVHYSTDYVFDGAKAGSYTEEDAPHPLNVYGRSKLAGERAVASVGGRFLVFRTSWVYAARGLNFLKTMLALGAERSELRVVDDQRGAPTWARLVAESTVLVLSQVLADDARARSLAGIYHLTNVGEASWREFAESIFEEQGADRRPKVVPISSADYSTPARRPMNSCLSNRKIGEAFGIYMPAWRDALSLCCAEMRRAPR